MPSSKTSISANRNIVLSTTAIFFFWMSLYFYVPFLPIHTLELGASNTVLGIVIASYAIGQMLLRIPVGVMSDLLGRRKPFVLIAFIASSAGALGLFFAPSPSILFLARSLTGVAGAGWVAITVLYISYFHSSKTDQAMSWVMFVNAFGIVVATFVGGVIGELYGGVSTFFAGFLSGLIGTILILLVKEPQQLSQTAMSWADFLRVGRNPLLLRISLIGVLIHFVTFAVSFSFVPVYAVSIGATEFQNGLIAGAMFIFSAAGNLATPKFVEKFGYRNTLVFGLFIIALSVAVIPLLHSPVLLMVSQAAGGLGRGMSQLILMTLAVLVVPGATRTTSMGIYQALYAIGMFAGPVIAGFVADFSGVLSVFWVCAVVSLASCVIGVKCPVRAPSQN
ncbi:MAG: MFS transporter [Dehalococcoidia bacterium]|nr:MFS transporter [Dehalococcoidia bacterium]